MGNKSSDAEGSSLISWAAAGAGLFLAGSAVFHHLTRFNLNGKVVLVTGGSRGLGLELSHQLIRKGAMVAICARSEDQLENARAELAGAGGEVLALQADVTRRSHVRKLVRDVIAHFGRIDVLINNAGIVQVGPARAMRIEDYEEAMKTNFWAALYTMYAVIPGFIEQKTGRIVNITSIGGKIAMPHLLPYVASKFALVGLSEGMSAELKKFNIQVTTVVPNLMRTGSPPNALVKGDHEKEYAWFKYADSLPLTSQPVERAAANIIRALEYGSSEAILTATAKVATVVKGFAPAWVSSILALVNKLLPDDGGEAGVIAKKGRDAESRSSRGLVQSLTDRAAVRHNER